MIWYYGMSKNIYPTLSRREFLTTTIVAGGAMPLAPACMNAAGDDVDPRVAQIMSSTIGIDLYNQVYPAGTARSPLATP